MPRPIDAEFLDKTGKSARAFVFNEFRQRACRRGEGHRDDRAPQIVDFDAVDQTKVDDIDTQFGIDHLMQRLFDVLCRRTADIIHGDQRDVVIVVFITVMLAFLLAVLAARAPIVLGYPSGLGRVGGRVFGRRAECAQQLRVGHDFTRGVVIAQSLGYRVKNRGFRFGDQIVLICHHAPYRLSRLRRWMSCLARPRPWRRHLSCLPSRATHI